MPARPRVSMKTFTRMSTAHAVLAVDGTAYLNAVDLDGHDGSLEEVLRCALAEEDVLFIGVRMTDREARSVVRHLEGASSEPVAFVVGRRMRKKRSTAAHASTKKSRETTR